MMTIAFDSTSETGTPKLSTVNSSQTEDGKSRSWEELFSKYFVNVNVILNFKKEMCIHLKPIPKEDDLCR